MRTGTRSVATRQRRGAPAEVEDDEHQGKLEVNDRGGRRYPV